MRFNDPKHITAWKAKGVYPAIHADVFQLAAETLARGPVLDLCCSIGLLGRRIHDVLGEPVLSVDADETALEVGTAGDVYPATPVHLRVTDETLPELQALLVEHGIRSVVARRCFMELAAFVDLGALAETFTAAGVARIVIEGHIVNGATKNPLASADAQCAALTGWKITDAYRNCRALTPT